HLQEETPGCFVHVIMGHLVMDTFWEQALHQNSAYIFNLGLNHMEQVVVTTVPYQIHRQDYEEAEREAALAAQANPTTASAAELQQKPQPVTPESEPTTKAPDEHKM
ncbi:MAG TPA: hypothetical protein VHL11_02130, partial [Phototrophicaceae bacterium]|nr:hypothetical protein [Phototrophicaceae bacterium]